MNALTIVETLCNRKGQHVKAVWSRPAKTFKDCPLSIVKRTSVFVRAGIDYANLASVKAEVEAGTRGEVEPLPWGEWTAFPFVITHRGQSYVRLYPAVFDNLKPTVEWTIDGRPASFAEVEPYLLASEKRKDDEPAKCFTIKAESLISIG